VNPEISSLNQYTEQDKFNQESFEINRQVYKNSEESNTDSQ